MLKILVETQNMPTTLSVPSPSDIPRSIALPWTLL